MKFSEYMNSDYEGAGFLFLTKDKRVLFLQKPNKKWSLVGGHKEKNESPLETAERECKEEIGFLPKGNIIKTIHYTKTSTNSDCYSFIMEVEEEFVPKISHEHIGYKWAKYKKMEEYVLSKAVKDMIPQLKSFLDYYQVS